MKGVQERRPRNPNVSDEKFIEAWQRISMETDKEGNKTGTQSQVAEELNMKLSSFRIRLGKIRKKLKEASTNEVTYELNQMRDSRGRQKRTAKSTASILTQVNESLAIPEKSFDGNPSEIED